MTARKTCLATRSRLAVSSGCLRGRGRSDLLTRGVGNQVFRQQRLDLHIQIVQLQQDLILPRIEFIDQRALICQFGHRWSGAGGGRSVGKPDRPSDRQTTPSSFLRSQISNRAGTAKYADCDICVAVANPRKKSSRVRRRSTAVVPRRKSRWERGPIVSPAGSSNPSG